MKRYLSIILSILCILLFIGCGKNVEHETETPSQDYFNAIVLEIKNGVVLAECTECESGAISVGSQVSVNLDTVSSEEIPLLVVGDTIRVVYIGEVMESDPLKLQEVLSIFWVDPNGEIVTEGAEILEIKHYPEEKPDWGLTFEVDEVSPKGLYLLCTHSSGSETGELQTSAYYIIEKWSEEFGWEELNWIPQKYPVVWPDEAWGIRKNDVNVWRIDWDTLYGKLAAGKYRIGKEVIDFRDTGDCDSSMFYVEFIIEE